MEPKIVVDAARVFHGDCRDVLKTLPDNSVDSVVTDPPYELGFMGKKWDSSGIAYDVTVWEECFRVLKPGGHILAFGGSRTWHRLAVAVEDAGFELRDSIAWLYGSGFPKSLDVSKAIDKRRDDDSEEIHAVVRWLEQRRKDAGVTRKQVERHFGTENIGQSIFTITPGSKSRVPTWEQWGELKLLFGFDDSMDAEVWRLNGLKGKPGENWHKREVIGQRKNAMQGWSMDGETKFVDRDITLPATSEAQKWQGWGTALKPAFEPIVVGRKPLGGNTVAENVLEWGTGGLNIDGSRIGTEVLPGQTRGVSKIGTFEGADGNITPERAGRWPANVMLDEYTAELLDQQSGQAGGGFGVRGKGGQTYANGKGFANTLGETGQTVGYGDSGGASRFFFVADTLTHSRIDLCENINANSVAKLLNTIRATIESSAQTNVEDSPNESNVHAVKNAGIQCDSCATHIAADLVALKTLASNEETSTHFHRSINDFGNSILNQNLVSFVEKWVSTDTIPTMTDFSTLFGCALLAIDAPTKPENLENDSGRSRFIYQAKASKRDRNEGLDELEAKRAGSLNMRTDDHSVRNGMDTGKRQNFHPTVKPTQLMRYLIKLVTPPGGTVLDPFTGSGSTGKAALLDGFEFVGAELTGEYLPIIEGRLRWAVENRDLPEETLF